jgi:hypothetical protein
MKKCATFVCCRHPHHIRLRGERVPNATSSAISRSRARTDATAFDSWVRVAFNSGKRCRVSLSAKCH